MDAAILSQQAEDGRFRGLAYDVQERDIDRCQAVVRASICGLSRQTIDVKGVTPNQALLDAMQRRFRRQLVRWGMRNREQKVVRDLFYDTWFWLKFTSGYTGAQIASYLDVSIGTVAAINNRMQAIHDNLAFVDADAEFEVD